MPPNPDTAGMIMDLSNSISTRMDAGFDNIQSSIDSHMNNIRTEVRDELHRVHERFDEQQRKCDSRLVHCSAKLGQKADRHSVSSIAKNQEVQGKKLAKLSAKQRLIIYILSGSGGFAGAGYVILRLVTG